MCVYKCAGEQFDVDLGLYYLRARWYRPMTGRFLTADLVEGKLARPASHHRYVYAHAAPVELSDPLGKSATEQGVIVSFTNHGAANLADMRRGD